MFLCKKTYFFMKTFIVETSTLFVDTPFIGKMFIQNYKVVNTLTPCLCYLTLFNFTCLQGY